jgi:hypothetical protein
VLRIIFLCCSLVILLFVNLSFWTEEWRPEGGRDSMTPALQRRKYFPWSILTSSEQQGHFSGRSREIRPAHNDRASFSGGDREIKPAHNEQDLLLRRG